MRGLEVVHSPPCSTEVQHKWCSAFHSPYIFRAIYFIKPRGYCNLFLVPVLRMLLPFSQVCVVFCNSLLGCLGVIYHKPIFLGFMDFFLFLSGKWNDVQHQNTLCG